MPHESLIFQDKPSIIKETLNTIGYLHFCAGFVFSVEGHFNLRLFNPGSEVEKFMVEKSGVEKSGVEKSRVKKSGIERSGWG